MPSLTPIVLNRIPTHSASVAPAFTCSASVLRCILHGLPSSQTLTMPTCGLSRSASLKPVASNIACDAPWIGGWVIWDEKGFSDAVRVIRRASIGAACEPAPGSARQPAARAGGSPRARPRDSHPSF